MLAKIKVLVAKVPTICAALDCQGGDSGQITAGGWGEGEGEIFKRVLLAFQEQKTCLQVSSFLVFKFSALRKVGKTTREMGLAGRARRVQSWVLWLDSFDASSLFWRSFLSSVQLRQKDEKVLV